jgi:hypothetical protein
MSQMSSGDIELSSETLFVFPLIECADQNYADELEDKTLRLQYNISRRDKMYASCGNILH